MVGKISYQEFPCRNQICCAILLRHLKQNIDYIILKLFDYEYIKVYLTEERFDGTQK